VFKQLVVALGVTLAALPLLLITITALAPATKTVTPESSPQQDIEAANQYLTKGLAKWQLQQYSLALQDFSFAANLGASDAKVYQHYVQRWLTENQVKHEPTLPIEIWASKGCLQQILLVSTELESLVQASRFMQLFQSDKRLTSLPICIAPQIVFAPDLLPCRNENQQSRISCDIKPLAPKLENKQFTHLVVFAKQGKAYVHNGIMYLDQQDTYDVFVHELAHFAGFVDEYPLSAELAKRVCNEAKAPNLVFKQVSQDQIDTRYWQQLKQKTDVALTPARTCDNHATQAFKPSAKMTFMEYYDVTRIPDFYLTAWHKALQRQQNLTPAFINFAQAFDEQPSALQAQYWRKRYEQYHQASVR
jgi:hypothetical protein